MWGWVWDNILYHMYRDFITLLTGEYWWVVCGILSTVIGFSFAILLDLALKWSERTILVREHPAPQKMIRYGSCDCNVPECAHVQRSRKWK